MGIAEIIGLISVGAPVITNLVKKIFKTDSLDNSKPVHQILPLVVGVAASCINNYTVGGDWTQAIMAGLAGGAGATYVRNFDKNVLGLVSGLAKIFFKDK